LSKLSYTMKLAVLVTAVITSWPPGSVLAQTSGPVFDPLPVDLNIQCLDDVPAPGEYFATSDCPGPIDYEVFTSETGYAVDSCVLSTAFGPGPDWALWLPDLFNSGDAASVSWMFSANGYFVSFNDGTAHLYGDVVNSLDPTQGFHVDMWFANAADWSEWSAQGRSYKDDMGYAAAGGNLWEDWTYYEMVNGFSTLTGFGAYAGSELYLTHYPTSYYFGFQVGQAANSKNAEYGMSGWFGYTGWFNGEAVDGHGDINTNTDCYEIPQLDCIHNTSLTYFYRATDACDNTTTVSQTITVLDTLAPTFYNCPENITLECTQDIPAVASMGAPNGVYALDNCSGSVELLYLGEFVVENENSTICNYQIERIWQATDICGNRSYCTHTITVIDTTSPVFTFVPADITYNCEDNFTFQNAIATDNCLGSTLVTSVSTTVEGDCPYAYVTTINFTSVDSCGNVASAQQVITVVDITAPVFEPYDMYVSMECNEVYLDLITASDNCGEVTVTYVDILQSGGCIGVIARTYTAVDECGNSATAIQYITIIDTTPAVINNPENFTVECSEVPMMMIPNAIDACGYPVTVTGSEAIFPGDCEDSYTIVWTWTATDYCDNVSQASTTVTVVDTTDPTFGPLPADFTIQCGIEIPVAVLPLAFDNCDDDVLVTVVDETSAGDCPQAYNIQRIYRAFDNCGNMVMYVQNIYVVDTTAPVFGDNTSVYTYECTDNVPVITPSATDNCGTVSYSHIDTENGGLCVSSIIRVWTAVDQCGNASTFTQLINILDTTAPVITGTFEIFRPCDNYLGVFVSVTDNCNEWTISYTDLPLSGGCQGRIQRTYIATDLCGNTSEYIQIINLTDFVLPTVVGVNDFTVQCEEPYTVPTPVFSDNCDVQLSIESSINTVSVNCTTFITYTWTATDNCGNSISSDVVVSIVDTIAPFFTSVPANMQYSCETDFVPGVATAGDLCSDVVTVSVSQSVTPGDCPQEYIIVYTYTAMDNCGNMATANSSTTIFDNQAPVWGTNQSVYTYECTQNVPVITPSATDNCGTVSYSYIDTENGGLCVSSITRVWTAVDQCGNASTFTQLINILDTTAPVITGTFEIFRPCDNYLGVFVSVTDNCNEWTISYTDLPLSGGCQGRIQRTYIATDLCGNTSEYIQIINLTDFVLPTVVGVNDFTVQCEEPYTVPTPVFSDNCDVQLSIESSINTVSVNCTTFITYTWTATDNCGNSISSDVVVSIVDTIAPFFTSVPANMQYSCETDFVPGVATAGDLCSDVVTVSVSQSVTPGDCPQEYIIVYTYTAMDNCGNMATANSSTTIFDNQAPVWGTNQSVYTYECTQNVPVITPSATDNCGTVSYSYIDTETGGPCVVLCTRVWTAVDQCGNASTFTQLINILDTTAPVITADQDIFKPCDNYIGIFISVTDNCNQWTVTYTDLPISGGCQGRVQRSYVVTDACGNTSSFVQIINLTDFVLPTVVGVDDFIVQCDEDYSVPLPIFSDNCDAVLAIQSSVVTTGGGCATFVTYTWTATDNCGNSVSSNVVVTITDTDAPYFFVEGYEITVDCNSTIEIPTPIAFDLCDEDVQVVESNSTTPGTCNNEWTEVTTFTAVDDCGNNSYISYIVHYVDNVAPSFTFIPASGIYSCTEMLPNVQATASDICGDVVITSSESYDYECPQTYTLVITWTATDECGNSSNAYTTYSVSDTTAPIIIGNLQNISLECEVEIVPMTVQVTDNCSSVSLDVNVVELQSDTCGNGVWQVVYVAMDQCGNTSTASYLVTVEDVTAPILSPIVLDLVLDCQAEIPMATMVNAFDNCDDDITVSYTETFIGEVPLPGSETPCDLVTPDIANSMNCTDAYNNTSWSMWLGSLPTAYKYYSVVSGSFEEFDNGTAQLNVTLVNANNPDAGFTVSASYAGGFTWAEWDAQGFPTGFKADCGGLDANYQDWTYYIMDDGATLTGWGDYAGSVLTISHAPNNNYFGYQVGQGANNLTPAFGSGGWFEYSGPFLVNGQSIFNETVVSGAGDFAFEHDCCPDYEVVRTWCATDCSGNTTCISQNISFADLDGTNDPGFAPGEDNNMSILEGDFSITSLKPNPTRDQAVISFMSNVNTTLTMEIYDLSGRRIAQPFNGNVKSGDSYNVNFDTQRLEDGVYTVRLYSLSEQKVVRMMVAK